MKTLTDEQIRDAVDKSSRFFVAQENMRAAILSFLLQEKSAEINSQKEVLHD